MRGRVVAAVCGVLIVAGLASAAVYKEGKTVTDKQCVAEIVKMKWGIKDAGEDRLLGTIRLYVPFSKALEETVLTFQVFDVKAEVIDTMDISFNFRRFGFKKARDYIEGEFCQDFPTRAEARRLTLANVKFMGEAVTYRTTYNISGNLNKTAFKLSEPKTIPVSR